MGAVTGAVMGGVGALASAGSSIAGSVSGGSSSSGNLSDVLGETLQALGGGLSGHATQHLDWLESMPPDQLTAAQQKRLGQLQGDLSQSQETSFAPQYLQYVKNYLPQFEQEELNIYNQFAPQLAQAQLNAQKSAQPDYYALRDKMMSQAQQNVGQGLNAQQQGFYANQYNAQNAAKGIYNSPLGSQQEATQLTQLNLQQQQQNWQNAQNALNAYQLINPNVAMPNITNLFASPSMSGMMGIQNDSVAAATANSYAQSAQQANSLSGLAGSLSAMGSQMGNSGMFGGGSSTPSYMQGSNSFADPGVYAPPIDMSGGMNFSGMNFSGMGM